MLILLTTENAFLYENRFNHPQQAEVGFKMKRNVGSGVTWGRGPFSDMHARASSLREKNKAWPVDNILNSRVSEYATKLPMT